MSRRRCDVIVWKRDQGRCAFVGRAGRCAERGFLEFHHVAPVRRRQEATVANLELRCRAHNRYRADVYFTPSSLIWLTPDYFLATSTRRCMRPRRAGDCAMAEEYPKRPSCLYPWPPMRCRMRTLAILAVCSLLAIADAIAQSAAPVSGDEAAIREVVRKYVDAREKRDPALIAALFTGGRRSGDDGGRVAQGTRQRRQRRTRLVTSQSGHARHRDRGRALRGPGGGDCGWPLRDSCRAGQRAAANVDDVRA